MNLLIYTMVYTSWYTKPMIIFAVGDAMEFIAKIFRNGRSQAVRLPAAFRFSTREVFIRRDSATGDVILSSRPSDWAGFTSALALIEDSAGFLGPEERDLGLQDRDPFEAHEK